MLQLCPSIVQEIPTMNQRTLVLIAAAITTFVLVLIGGLASTLSGNAALAPTSVATSAGEAPTTLTSGGLDPTVEALIRQREAEYQAALADTQVRLEQANSQLAQVGSSQASPPVPASAPGAPAVVIDSAQAQTLALAAAPGATLVRAPELVLYANVPAYEVQLDRGSVYIDAAQGTVLANSAVAATATGATIGEAAAIAAATSYLGGGSVRSVELEHERNILVYEVKFTDGSSVYIDAGNGQVAYAKVAGANQNDDDDDDDNDD
jgi:uncharacterized membrane protein YkoI